MKLEHLGNFSYRQFKIVYYNLVNRNLLNRDLRRHQSNSSDNPQGYVHPYIDNLLNAIQQGILTPSTKQRMEELEQQKSELSVQIMKEEMTKPSLTKDQIVFLALPFPQTQH